MDAILRQLAVDAIAGAPGLVELGPKQSRGGAARVFLYRHLKVAVLVAAGVEKGTKGVHEINAAKARASAIRKLKAPRAQLIEVLTKDYKIITHDTN